MSEFKYIKYRKEENACSIVLDNPPLNIITLAMMSEINTVLSELKNNLEMNLLIIKANGDKFSTGAAVEEHTKERCPEMIPEFTKIFKNLNAIPFPTIALVQGLALGGGCELAVFCDIVIASQSAQFGQPEILLGVFPPVAAAVFPLLIGRNRTLELLLTGESISAEEAQKAGLVNRVFPDDLFDEMTDKFISKIRKNSPVSLRLTKKAVDAGMSLTVMQAIDKAEDIYLHELMETFDANEGIQSFIERRKPVWKGR